MEWRRVVFFNVYKRLQETKQVGEMGEYLSTANTHTQTSLPKAKEQTGTKMHPAGKISFWE